MDLSNLHFTSIAGMTAIGAVLATTWRYITTGIRYLIGTVIGTVYVKDDAADAVKSFTYSRAIRSPIGARVFGGAEYYVHPKRWIEAVGFECIGKDPILIRYKKSFLLISQEISRDHLGETRRDNFGLKIMYLRFGFNIDMFIIDALEIYNSSKRKSTNTNDSKKTNNRFRILRISTNGTSKDQKSPNTEASPMQSGSLDSYVMSGVYRLLKWNVADLKVKSEEGQSPFTGYPFPNDVQESIKELDCWLSNEKWFRSKSIPWRRGWLLYGVPGTGKSTLVRALGMTFDLPVFIFDLSGMSNKEFVTIWEEAMTHTPCIALIEDIDSIFHGREYIGPINSLSSHITFDCLLNCISGVKAADGVFTIITTNHIEHIDPAIGIPDSNGKSSRPGRIDKAICLGVMEREQRLALATHILSDFPDLIEDTVNLGVGETAAQFQSRCGQLALQRFWEDTKFREKQTQDSYTNVIQFKPTSPEKIDAPVAKYFNAGIVGVLP